MTVHAAVSAASFTGALGVNTHFDFGSYGYQNLAIAESALAYLGLANVRDSAQSFGDSALWTSVAAATGVKFDDYIAETSPAGMQADLNLVPALAKTGILNAIEGGNEEDDPFPVSLGNSQYKAAQFQQQVWSVGHGLGLPVINISFGAGWTAANNWQGDYGTVGDLSPYANYANAHSYPVSGQTPDFAIQRLNGLAQLAASSRPVMTTEIGWDANTFDRTTVAKYTLDAAFDGIKDGDVRMYFYALFDDGAGKLGLMSSTGASNPAGAALHNLTGLMSDTGAKAGSFSPGSLDYSVGGQIAGDNSLLFEKSDGSFWIAIWNEQQALGSSHTVQLSLGKSAAAIRVYDPMKGTAPVQKLMESSASSGVGSISVAVPDHPILVEVTPQSANLMAVTATQSSVSVASVNRKVLGISGNHTLFLSGSQDTIELSGGSSTIKETGSGNRVVPPGPSQGSITVTGPVMTDGDVLDFRKALAGTSWDRLAGDVASYLHVSEQSGATVVKISKLAGGTGSVVLKLPGVTADLNTLLRHSVI